MSGNGSANGQASGAVSFRVLTTEQCERIVQAALAVLEETGAAFLDPQAADILLKAGCRAEGPRVRIPAGVVRQALASAPQQFTLFSRGGEPSLTVAPGRAHFGPGPTCPYFIDPASGARRPFVKNDARLAARVCDALEQIDYVMSLGSISDVPPEQADVHEFDAMVRETTKPIMSWSFTRDSLARIHAMCAAVKGSEEAFAREPFMIFYAEPTSPLEHSPEALRKLLYCAERGIPLVYSPCPIGGATAPATLAGILVQDLAETLGGVVLSQLIRPGTPLVVGGVVSILDMRTTILSYGAPELSLLSAAATEVARHLRLPMFSTAGCTDAKTLDQQAAIESTLSIVCAALSGADFVHDVGFSESAMTGSLELLVMGDEIISMARHVARGLRVTDETLAVEVIGRAAGDGSFLDLEHTRNNFRREFWFPGLLDRSRWGEWRAAGGRTLGDRVRDKVRRLIAEHRAPPLSADVTARLDGIMAAG
jgi:trimethylamine--corrinoid protein Co-methyltransferase